MQELLTAKKDWESERRKNSLVSNELVSSKLDLERAASIMGRQKTAMDKFEESRENDRLKISELNDVIDELKKKVDDGLNEKRNSEQQFSQGMLNSEQEDISAKELSESVKSESITTSLSPTESSTESIISTKDSQIKELQKKLAKSKSRNEELFSQLEVLDTESERMSDEITLLKTRQSEYEEEILKLKNENAGLKADFETHSDSKEQDESSTNTSSDSQSTVLNNSLPRHETKIQALKDTIVTQSQSFSLAMAAKEKYIQNQRNKLDELVISNDFLKTEVDKLEELTRDLKAEITLADEIHASTMASTKKEFESRLKEGENTVEGLKVKLKETMDLKRQGDTDYILLENDYEKVLENSAGLKKKMEMMEKEHSQKVQVIAGENADIIKKKDDQIECLQKACEDLESSKKLLLTEVAQWTELLVASEDEVTSGKAQLQIVETQNSKLSLKLMQFESQVNGLESHTKALNCKIEILEKTLAKKNERVSILEKDITSRSNNHIREVCSIKTDFFSKLEELNQTKTGLEAKLEQADNSKMEIFSAYEHLQHSFNQHKGVLEISKNQCQTLLAKVRDLERDAFEVNKKHREEVSLLGKDNSEKLVHKDEQIQSLTNCKMELLNMIADLESDCSAKKQLLEEQRVTVSKDKEELLKLLETKDLRISELESNSKLISTEAIEFKKKLMDLESKKAKENAAQMKKISDLEKRILQLEENANNSRLEQKTKLAALRNMME